MREGFNAKLNAVKIKKQKLQAEVIKLIETLKRIHAEIPFKSIKPLPHPPKLDFDFEFPEYKLEVS